MRLRHADRAVVRPGPRPTGERRPGTRLPTAQERQDLPAPHPPVLLEKHAREDDRLGEPLCPDCYDYTGAVLFNACAPELWRRFTITLRRTLARQAGFTGKALAAQLRVSYAKVAEYQRRGVVHFHAIIRLDGPAGPADAPPAWVTIALLTTAIDQAARAVSVTTPAAPGLAARMLAWGRQLDIRPVTANGDVTDTKVARYVANTPPRAAECTGTLDRRLTPADRIADLPVRDHARRHIAACLRLGKLSQLKELRLAAWAHMLGFRGHFSTKSRAYSVTLGSLRADRAAHQREYAIAAGLQPDLDPGTTLVLTDWRYAGRAHPLMTCWPPTLCPRRRGEVRHAPAPADRPRSRRDPGHLPQQALRTDGQRRHRLDPYRRITPHPASPPWRITSPGCSPKGPPPDARNHPQEHAPAPRWRHETRHHLVVRDPRKGPRDGD